MKGWTHQIIFHLTKIITKIKRGSHIRTNKQTKQLKNRIDNKNIKLSDTCKYSFSSRWQLNRQLAQLRHQINMPGNNRSATQILTVERQTIHIILLLSRVRREINSVTVYYKWMHSWMIGVAQHKEIWISVVLSGNLLATARPPRVDAPVQESLNLSEATISTTSLLVRQLAADVHSRDQTIQKCVYFCCHLPAVIVTLKVSF